MRGIATQCEHRPFTGPEAEGLEPGINGSLRLFADPGISSGAGSVEEQLPVRANVTPI